MPSTEPRSYCPINLSLEIFGDSWTLLILRDMMFSGKRHFRELLASDEGISTNILADRLDRLERRGLVERRRYQEHPPRDEYHPTARCRALRPVMRALIRWGQRHVPGTAQHPPRGLAAPPRRG